MLLVLVGEKTEIVQQRKSLSDRRRGRGGGRRRRRRRRELNGETAVGIRRVKVRMEGDEVEALGEEIRVLMRVCHDDDDDEG